MVKRTRSSQQITSSPSPKKTKAEEAKKTGRKRSTVSDISNETKRRTTTRRSEKEDKTEIRSLEDKEEEEEEVETVVKVTKRGKDAKSPSSRKRGQKQPDMGEKVEDVTTPMKHVQKMESTKSRVKTLKSAVKVTVTAASTSSPQAKDPVIKTVPAYSPSKSNQNNATITTTAAVAVTEVHTSHSTSRTSYIDEELQPWSQIWEHYSFFLHSILFIIFFYAMHTRPADMAIFTGSFLQHAFRLVPEVFVYTGFTLLGGYVLVFVPFIVTVKHIPARQETVGEKVYVRLMLSLTILTLTMLRYYLIK